MVKWFKRWMVKETHTLFTHSPHPHPLRLDDSIVFGNIHGCEYVICFGLGWAYRNHVLFLPPVQPSSSRQPATVNCHLTTDIRQLTTDN
jgi:hypothetical protein